MTLPTSDARLPTGPNAPQTLGIDPDTLALLRGAQAEYGNFVLFTNSNGRRAYFVNDAVAIRKLLVKQHARYGKGPGFERVKMLLGNGLIVSDGAIWRRSRTMIQPAFSRQNVHRLIPLMAECSERRAISWQRAAAAGERINITQEMSDFALELILRAIFGPDYERHIMAGGSNPFEFLSKDSKRDLRVVMQLRELRALLLMIIEQRRTSSDTELYDFLSIYLHARDKEGNSFSDEELLDELMTLIVAGYETSAGTLNWAWYLLAGHPEIENRLLAESIDVIASPQTIEKETLTNMGYCQQLLEETLRLYPPVWLFTRRAHEDDELSDFDVLAGTDLYLSPYILQRSPEYWTDPDTFDPTRFGPASQYAKGDRPYFPFSLGPRRCLGEYFSFLEMKVHLGLLIKKFHMTLDSDEVPELDLGINLRSRDDIFLRPQLRDNH